MAPTTQYADSELTIYNKGYFLSFYHIPSGKTVKFKAMITSFSDKYASSWEDKPVYGRNDPIVSFKCTKREISLAWDVVAASLEEAKTNLEKSSLLLSMLYPSYASGTGGASTIASAPMFKLSFANLIQSVGSNKTIDSATTAQVIAAVSTGQNAIPALVASTSGGTAVSGLVGKMSGLSYDPVMEAGFFDLPGGILYPQEIKFSCTYTVIHTHALGWDENKAARLGFGNFPYGTKYTQKAIGGTKTSAGVSKSKQIKSAQQKKMEK